MGGSDETRELLRADAALPGVNTLLRVLLGERGGNALIDAVARVAQGQSPDALGRIDGGMADLPTRVEDVVPAQRRGERSQVVIAAPRYAGDVEAPAAGAPCALVWATARGVIELPTEYQAGRILDQGLRVWDLAVAGPAVRLQRRAFVRVPVSVSVTVVTARLDGDPLAGGLPPDTHEDDAPLPETLLGRTLDLSEGGMRCLLPAPALPSDLPVTVTFSVEGEPYRLSAAVVRAVPGRGVSGRGDSGGVTGMFETAIRFVSHGARADDLRRAVFAEQLRLRRSGLG